VLIGIIINLIFGREKSAKREGETTPHEISKKRYAKGEITKQEFEKMKKDLE
jgi:putative membrane protein